MEKAILVLDMPKKCADCTLRCSIVGQDTMCFATMRTLTNENYYKEKPSFCPLKPMPNERQEYFLVELENEDESKRESTNFDSVAIGFNQCLQEILDLEKEKD